MIYIIAPTIEIGQHVAKLLQLRAKPQFRRQEQSQLDGMTARPGDLFIWVNTPKLQLSWHARSHAVQVKSDLRVFGQIRLLEYTCG